MTTTPDPAPEDIESLVEDAAAYGWLLAQEGLDQEEVRTRVVLEFAVTISHLEDLLEGK